jgi:nucleoside phosphorylase
MKKVALIVAMEAEAEGLVESLGLNAVEPNQFYAHLPFRFFCGNYKNCLEISITLPGKDSRFGVDNIGTEPAAVATFAAIKEFAPDVLINAGTAGSFAKKGAHVGKVYLSESAFFFHDHRIPIQGWDKFGIGELPSLDVRNLALRLGLETANVSSGN